VTPFVRTALLAAARSRALRAFAVRQGMRFGAARFVAGTTLDDFVNAARAQNALHRKVAAGYLGEGVADRAESERIAADFVAILERIALESLDANVAVKLSHLGLDAGVGEAERNLGAVVDAAGRLGNFIRIDMEESSRVDATLRIYRAVHARSAAVGVVLQACLRRSLGDLRMLAPLAPNVRLVKGAYLEPVAVAYPRGPELDARFLALIGTALRTIPFTAVATHDDRIIEATIALAREAGIEPQGRFEFQMLLGVREPLQAALVARGYPVRVSVPFGSDWYPYLMRRMAENPKNLGLILRNWRG
jgi:proline dehydrogenase